MSSLWRFYQTNTLYLFYPTFMNGDAEWQGDFCDVHKAEAKVELNPFPTISEWVAEIRGA